jgi:Putative transmembrane protein (PGPGW)
MSGKSKEGWQHWQRFKRFEPGHRFQTRYHRRRREQGQTSKYGRIFNLVGGPVLLVAGFVFLPTPGPSYIIIVLGLWMLAGEFLVLARFFDRVEVSLRKLGRRVKAFWTGSTTVVRVSIVLATLICVVALIYALVS